MRFFELDIDEDQVRSLIKWAIDKYEIGIRAHGSYQRALKAAQEETVQSLESAAELIDYNTETMH